MPNRLAGESSPYLLQHADNPVEWLPWGEEALQRARQEDKPIFLSIGYASCHWCHVMAHESFEDESIAALLNRDFIPVKVDREERPDVDAVYMDAVVAMTGQGGWPLSVFLTPDGKPFFGGTYFPPARRHQMPAFREVLEAVARSWREDRARITQAGAALAHQIETEARALPSGVSVDPKVLPLALESLLRSYDWTLGGWGAAPKFPQAPVIQFLLERHAFAGDRLALDMAVHALNAMARGGIFDQLGGGFHRYSVDARWVVPHFEKMLYDNALLARAYLTAWRVTRDPLLREVAEATFEFLRREMRDERGGFFSSLDADTQGEEGRYYTWTPDEVAAALAGSGSAEKAASAFGVTPSGPLEGRSVLTRAQEVAPDQRETWTHALLEARARRTAPALDDKIVASWNGLALLAWSEAAQAWDRPADLDIAQQLAEFLLEDLSPGGKLLRSERKGRAGPRAFLEDHAAVGLGLLSLYQTDFDERWFRGAVDQADVILTRFADPSGALFDTPTDHEALLTRPRSYQDSPTPSGAAMASELLLWLSALTGDERYSRVPVAFLSSVEGAAGQHPTAFAAALANVQALSGPARQLAIVGDLAASAALLRVVRERFLPRLALAAGPPSESTSVPLLRGRTLIDGQPTAYLCEHFTCRLPVTSPEDLDRQIEVSIPKR
ncbi:MAG TPA: thioredoxin domain-containing protein [Anaerolineales bacterium]|nr:thioredoxin domain-containing protein [Anaerolineales bacterium]